MARDELILEAASQTGLFAFQARRHAVDALDEDHCTAFSQRPTERKYCVRVNVHTTYVRTYMRRDTIMLAMSVRLSEPNLRAPEMRGLYAELYRPGLLGGFPG